MPIPILANSTQYSLRCVFISQYSYKDDFVSMTEAQMGAKGGSVPNWGQGPLTSPWTALVFSGSSADSNTGKHR